MTFESAYELVCYPTDGRKKIVFSTFAAHFNFILSGVAVIPLILIALGYHEVTSFIIGVLFLLLYFFVIQPELLKREGYKVEIKIQDNHIQVKSKYYQYIWPINECAFEISEELNSDDAAIEWIKIIHEGTPVYEIQSKFIYSGPFSSILAEIRQSQKT